MWLVQVLTCVDIVFVRTLITAYITFAFILLLIGPSTISLGIAAVIDLTFLQFLHFSHYRNCMKSDGSCWGGSGQLVIRLFFLPSDYYCVSPLHHHLCYSLQPLYKLFQVSLLFTLFHLFFFIYLHAYLGMWSLSCFVLIQNTPRREWL